DLSAWNQFFFPNNSSKNYYQGLLTNIVVTGTHVCSSRRMLRPTLLVLQSAFLACMAHCQRKGVKFRPNTIPIYIYIGLDYRDDRTE
ncbi:hypothetical protein L9F63_022488, partial [Diploptera punctata]